MKKKILVFDVETPNRRNDRISSIGFAFIENNKIIDSQYFVVNPECEFDDINVAMTGIKPEDAELSPTFPIIWERYKDIFRDSLLVAHNASFDMCVLRKVLYSYGLDSFPVLYVDTMKMSQDVLPLAHHSLRDICEYYDIELNTHNALSDCCGCAQVLLRLIFDGVRIDDYISQYSLDENPEKKSKAIGAQITHTSLALRGLIGILEGITCDSVLTDAEVLYLKRWLDENHDLKGNYPYDKVYGTVEAVLEDEIIEQSELDSMLTMFGNIVNPVESAACSCYGKNSIEGKTICLSGEFEYGTKGEVENYLISRGSSVVSSVTKKTDILLVGSKGNNAWAAGNYGNKIKKALELQDKGCCIVIMKEMEVFGE